MIIIHLSVYVLQAGVKAKKATETYKSFVEKYATAKAEFEQKMAETAQVFTLCPRNTWWLPLSLVFNTLLFHWMMCVCVCWRVCSTFVPRIISRSCFFLCNGIAVETPDWIHLTDWLDQLQIEIRSVEFGLHILLHHSSSTTKSGSSDPLLSLEKAVRQPHFPRHLSQVISKTQF